MKKRIYILFLLLPVVVSAQQNEYKPSPLYSWENVGKVGFSAGTVGWTSLAFSLFGEPCLAYWDGVNSNKATVMKF